MLKHMWPTLELANTPTTQLNSQALSKHCVSSAQLGLFHVVHRRRFFFFRTNVLNALLVFALDLLHAQLRIRITLSHIYHGGNVGNECAADHAAALGALGFVSGHNGSARWSHSSLNNSEPCQRVQQL